MNSIARYTHDFGMHAEPVHVQLLMKQRPDVKMALHEVKTKGMLDVVADDSVLRNEEEEEEDA